MLSLDTQLDSYRKGYVEETARLTSGHYTTEVGYLSDRITSRLLTLSKGDVEDFAHWEGETQAIRDMIGTCRRREAEIAKRVEEAKAEAEQLRQEFAALRQAADERRRFDRGVVEGQKTLKHYDGIDLDTMRGIVEWRTSLTNSSARSRGFTQAYVDELARMEEADAKAKEEDEFLRGHLDGQLAIKNWGKPRRRKPVPRLTAEFVRGVVVAREADGSFDTPHGRGYTQAWAELAEKLEGEAEFQKGLTQARDMFEEYPCGLRYVLDVIETRERATDPTSEWRGFTQGYIERRDKLIAQGATVGWAPTYLGVNDFPCGTCGRG